MSGTAILVGKDISGRTHDVPVDPFKPHSLAVIDFIELAINEGRKFGASSTINIGVGVTKYMLGITNGKFIRLLERKIFARTAVANKVDIEVKLYEDGVANENVGNLTIFNNNRNSDTEATFAIHDTPTGVDIGAATLLSPFGGVMYSSAIAYSIISSNEDMYVMKENTKYVLGITNNGAAAVDVTFTWSWIESCYSSLCL